jgi:hypothetical protein
MKVACAVLSVVAMMAVGLTIAEEKGKEGGGKPKAVMVRGEITKIDPNVSITVTSRKEKAEETKTVAVDKDTKVRLESDQMEEVPGGEGGTTKKRPKIVDGTLADLKVGQKVAVTCTDDGSKATDILVPRVAPKGGKEGGKEGGAKEGGAKEGNKEGGKKEGAKEKG